ncbi:MAG: hypothetical protein IJL74_00505 [Bacilli bacterium]|nr:hypothetical protein [Bacilli bacterium]
MASSGSFNTTNYEGRYLKFSWSIKSQSTSSNKTVINWSLKGAGSAVSTWYMAGPFKVVVNGSTVYSSSSRITLYDGTTVASGTATISHNNDGTKTFSASAKGAIYSSSYNCSGSGSWALTSIPRYATISNFKVSQRDETSVTYSYSTDATCDSAWYRYKLNSSSSWGSWTSLPSNKIITGLTAGTKYDFQVRVRRQDSQLTTDSGTVSQTPYDYPKPTSLNDFVIGEGASVNVYNPLGRTYTLNIISDNDNSVIGTYTGTYAGIINNEFKTAEAIDAQYESIPNSNSGTYHAEVIYGSSTKTLGTGTYSTNTTDCSPSFSTFTYKDNNSSVTNITGNNQVFVKGLSIISVSIASANKMTTQKYATPVSYTASCENLNKSIAYSENNITNEDIGVINTSGLKRLNIRAYDSRGNSALAYQDITIYDYVKPTVNVTLKRLNDFEEQTTLKVSGTYTRLTIDNTDKNNIMTVQYRYREKGGTWGSWTNMSVTNNAGNYTCTDVVLALDNEKAFEFEIKATDKFDNNTGTGIVNVGVPIFFISNNQKTCYINGKEIIMYDVIDTW